MGRELTFRLGMEADVVAHVDKVVLLGSHFGNEGQSLVEGHVSPVILETQRVDKQAVEIPQISELLIGHRLHVGDVTDIVDAVAQYRQLSVHHAQRSYRGVSYAEGFVGTDVGERHVWHAGVFVLNETSITEELISEIADAIIKPGKQFMRVAFVGVDRRSCRKLKKLLYGHSFAIKFFDGIEPAKEWTLGKQNC